MSKCFVCDEHIQGKPVHLVMARTPYSNATLPAKIGELVGDDFMVVICLEDVVCARCSGLLNQLDKLENDLKCLRKQLTGFLATKYNLNAKDISAKFEKNVRAEGSSHASVNSKPVKEYRCALCNFITTDKEAVSLHAEECLQLPRGCTLCPKRFFKLEDHARHAVTVHGLAYPCEVCNSLFSSKIELKNHAKVHLRCDPCRTTFANQSDLEEHRKIAHTKEATTTEAKSDGNVVDDNDKDRVLEADIAAIEFHSCSACALTFLKASLYEEHMKLHQENRPSKLRDALAGGVSNKTDGETIAGIGDELEDLFEKLHGEGNVPSISSKEKAGDEKSSGAKMSSVDTNKITVFSPKSSSGRNSDLETSVARKAGPHKSATSHKGKSSQDVPQNTDSSCPRTEVSKTPERRLSAPRGGTKHKCCVCSKTFIAKHTFLVHMEIHAQEKNVKCITCGLTITDGGEMLMEHARKHMSSYQPLLYKCQYCDMTYKDKRSFIVHENTHDLLTFPCTKCDRRFQSQEKLSEHESRLHHTYPNCRICGKRMSNLRSLRDHESRHKGTSKKFECNICHRIFKTRTGFRNHQAVHTGKFKHFCDICGRGFMTLGLLEDHRAGHTKEERFVCDVCGRKFSIHSTYWIHRKWHDNPYPYKCTLCEKLFRHSSLLAVHKRKHTGERPYKCSQCSRSFIQGSTLKRHMILHTRAYPYSCKECKKGFTTRDKYSSHLAKVHGNYDLINQKNKTTDYKMAVHDHETSDGAFQVNTEGSCETAENVASNQGLAHTNNTETIEGDTPGLVDPGSMNILGNHGSTSARVVKIVMNDSYQAVATVTLAEVPNSDISDVWYQ